MPQGVKGERRDLQHSCRLQTFTKSCRMCQMACKRELLDAHASMPASHLPRLLTTRAAASGCFCSIALTLVWINIAGAEAIPAVEIPPGEREGVSPPRSPAWRLYSALPLIRGIDLRCGWYRSPEPAILAVLREPVGRRHRQVFRALDGKLGGRPVRLGRTLGCMHPTPASPLLRCCSRQHGARHAAPVHAVPTWA